MREGAGTAIVVFLYQFSQRYIVAHAEHRQTANSEYIVAGDLVLILVSGFQRPKFSFILSSAASMRKLQSCDQQMTIVKNSKTPTGD